MLLALGFILVGLAAPKPPHSASGFLLLPLTPIS